MSVEVDVFELIIAISVLMVAAFLIPVLIQLRATLRGVNDFVGEARKEVLPTLKELRETSERLNSTSSQVDAIAASLGEVGATMKRVNSFLCRDVGKYAGNAIGVWLGMKAVSKVLLKQLREQKGDK